MKTEDPVQFYYDLTDKLVPIDANAPPHHANAEEESKIVPSVEIPSLMFNRLVLVQSKLSEAQWFKVRLMLSHRFSKRVQRVRLWDMSMQSAAEKRRKGLEKSRR